MKKRYIVPCIETSTVEAETYLMASSISFGENATSETVVDVKENDWGEIWEEEEE